MARVEGGGRTLLCLRFRWIKPKILTALRFINIVKILVWASLSGLFIPLSYSSVWANKKKKTCKCSLFIKSSSDNTNIHTAWRSFHTVRSIDHACEANMFCLCKHPLHKQQLLWTSCVNCEYWVKIAVHFGPHNVSTASNTKSQKSLTSRTN